MKFAIAIVEQAFDMEKWQADLRLVILLVVRLE